MLCRPLLWSLSRFLRLQESGAQFYVIWLLLMKQRVSLLPASSWHLKTQIADWKECPGTDGSGGGELGNAVK